MKGVVSREIRLRQRPVGLPKADDFELVEVPVREPAAGEVLVRNRYISVDPYMRGRMADRDSYVTPYRLGEPLGGGCVGEIVASQDDRYRVGEHVLGSQGWREYFLSDGRGLTRIDPGIAPIQAYLGVMGMPGMTAYIGLREIGRLEAGETVFVSAASGAVGSVACQVAKIQGCRVVGSAGSARKVNWLLEEAGIDAALDYRETDNLAGELGRLCPDGIDIYFENVGGEHLEAALACMNRFGRVVVCGMISEYNATRPQPAPANLQAILWKRLTLRGFIVSDHYDLLPQFRAEMAGWIAAGRVKWQETVVIGIENAPAAFIGLFRGENLGKMVVKLEPEVYPT